jgi:ribonuclease VapC
MVIDTSALVAILLGEPEAESFAFAIAGDHRRLISAFAALESGIVIEAKKGESGGRKLSSYSGGHKETCPPYIRSL